MSDPTQYAVARLVNDLPLVTRALFAEIRQIAHPAHYYVLTMVEAASCPVSELAERLGVSLPSMSNMLDTLETRGWVRRAPAPHDGRMVLVEIQPAGEVVLREMREAASARLRAHLACLQPGEIDTLIAGLAVIEKAFTCSPARERAHAGDVIQSNA